MTIIDIDIAIITLGKRYKFFIRLSTTILVGDDHLRKRKVIMDYYCIIPIE